MRFPFRGIPNTPDDPRVAAAPAGRMRTAHRLLWAVVITGTFLTATAAVPPGVARAASDSPESVVESQAKRNKKKKIRKPSPAPVNPIPITPGSPDPSGEPMPVGDLPGWRQVFTDDFRTDVPLGQFPAAVSTKWDAYQDGWKDTSRNGTYYPSKVVSIGGGVMNMHLRTENGKHLVAAPVPKIPGATGSSGGMTYGRYAVRFRADQLPGYKTAWLLWPDSDEWAEGEIDFPEGDLDKNIWAFTHYKGDPNEQDWFKTEATYASWHTAVIEWTPTAVSYFLDGVKIGSSTDPSIIPDTPMYWVLQTETGLDGVAPRADVAGNVQVDWVAAYARN